MKLLLFGASGTAGSGVLRACLRHPAVTEVRVVARHPLPVSDPRLQLFLHDDYTDYTRVAPAFRGVDACLWCLGISVQQVSGEAEYRLITHDFAVAAARALATGSPGAVLHFLSGEGANPASRFMWARVKAETEQDLAGIGPTMCWRPVFIDGGAFQRGPALYRALRPLFRPLRFIRRLYVSSEDIGWAMLQAVEDRMQGATIDNAGIRDLADRSRAGKARA
jgi:uncharacterized protein YbjT (DUF2867 family)